MGAGTASPQSGPTGRAIFNAKFHLAIPAFTCSVAHAFDARFGEISGHATYP
jgi:hypothetical protein